MVRTLHWTITKQTSDLHGPKLSATCVQCRYGNNMVDVSKFPAVDAKMCDMACNAAPTENCGGLHTLHVYNIEQEWDRWATIVSKWISFWVCWQILVLVEVSHSKLLGQSKNHDRSTEFSSQANYISRWYWEGGGLHQDFVFMKFLYLWTHNSWYKSLGVSFVASLGPNKKKLNHQLVILPLALKVFCNSSQRIAVTSS